MAEKTNNRVQFPAKGMDLAATLFCGQSFSWQPLPDGSFCGVAGTRAALLRGQGETIQLTKAGPGPLTPADIDFWRDYLALDTPDYPQLLEKFSGHKKLAACVACNPGIRVLRQPFFDTLLCFILSQNNHIPRITGIAARLREMFGQQLAPGLYSYPTPKALAGLTVEQLAPLRAGFRAKYLIDAAQKVASGQVQEEALRRATDDEAREMLMQINGVGQKVADCVLLYALGRTRVAPMDVWMKRAMASTFPRGMPRVARGYEGIAQQYIFCWARQHLG